MSREGLDLEGKLQPSTGGPIRLLNPTQIMKASTFNLSGTIQLSTCIVAIGLAAFNLRAQTGPPCIDTNAVKFLMPPQVNGGLDVRDSRPVVSGQLPGTSSNILADDFFCNTTGPVIGIHIWGSWLNDNHGTITNFWLGIYNDVPAITNGTVITPSHPGTVQLWQQSFGFGQYSESIYTNGSEQFMDPTGQPRIIGADSTVWYYCFNPATPFVQQGTAAQPTNYWLLVRAQIADNSTVFGWKSSSSNYNDVAVWGNVDTVTGNPLGDWQPPMTNPVTLAPINLSFKIDTGTNNQPPPPLPCIETNGNKFVQGPLIDGGLDVRDSGGDVVLADDFFCDTSGPITDIHLWGSWLNDLKGTITNFWIGIYSEVPAVTNFSSGQVTPSKPGILLWQQSFGPGQFAENPYGSGSEQFLDPVAGAFMGPDTQAYYYCFYPTNPFVQQGTAANPTNYFLAVYASLNNQAGPPGLYGWKTARANYNDPAVWGNVGPGGIPVGNWQSMTNPQTLSPIGLSFKLTTPTNPPPPPVCDERDGAKYVQLPNFQGLDTWDSAASVLADDFVCTNTGPVSDIHLWGSWANDVQPDPTTTFWLAIYDDVPVSATNSFSYPGHLLWNEVFPPGQYIQSFYGTGSEQFWDPNTGKFLGPESNIWYYCFYPTNIFTQQGSASAPKTYWLMVYAQVSPTVNNAFGWKTTTVVSNDVSVHAPWPGSPPTANPGWKPTVNPSSGTAFDLAFKITTATTPPCLNFSCPPNVNIFAPCGSSCALLTNIPPFFATNLCDPADLTVTFNPPLATYCFPANGIPTPVTMTVSGSGQSANCTFTVTVNTNANCPPTNDPPCLTLDCPADMTLYAPCGSSCVTVSNYPPVFATNFCAPAAGVTITFNPPPGTYCFPANGVATPVTVTASGSGQTTNCTFSVTVLPNTNCPPTNNPPCLDFQCPTNMFLLAPCGSSCAIVSNYPPVFATDVCDPTGGGVTITYNPPPGTYCFPANGVATPVTVTVSGSGEVSNCTFSVTVQTNANCLPTNNPPCLTFDCPTNMFLLAPCGSSCVVVSNYPPVFATNFCDPASGVSITFNPPPGTYCFPANGVATPVTVTVTGGGETSNCTFSVTVQTNANCLPTNNPPCLTFDCPTNMTLLAPCGSSCVVVSNYPPIFATNFCNPLAGPTITYNPPPGTYCFPANGVPTTVTVTVSGSGETSNCTFSVTVLTNTNCPPTNNPPCLNFDCPTNMFLFAPCGSNCVIVSNYPPVFATNVCAPAAGVTITYNPPPGTFCFPANGVATPVTVTVSGSGETSNCTFSVTVVPNPNCPPPVSCVVTNGIKYVQGPNPNNGLDVWNGSAFPPNVTDGPWVLADDFVCTNTGPITDIHLWGSWLNNQVGTNSITFWLAMFANVPANPPGQPFSQPGALIWSQCFSPGQYSENFYGPSDETFIDPGPPATLGADSQIWYYCFYPTNPPTQQGTASNPQIYWLAVFAQQPAGTAGSFFGWKTTTNVQNDISVHAQWTQGFCPASIAGTGLSWTPNRDTTGKGLDLSFMLTTQTNSPCPAPPTLYCTNMIVECGTSWSPIPPGVSDPCCTPPPAPVLVTSVTNSTTTCPSYVTNIWKVTDCQNLTATCEQTVTVQDTNGPIITCATNKTVISGSTWNFDPPTATDPCAGTTLPVTVVSTVTNGTNPCIETFTRTWQAVDGCNLTNFCSQTVTNKCPPVACVESDREKYVQGPNTIGGYDVWNTPYVLADDFICTTRGPVSDIHLWGSWLSDSPLTNTIIFWLGIYDDVPAATNGPVLTPSHPGTNLMWQQWFYPGQYAETIWTANAQEQFLDPGSSNIIGSDSVVWYYCFYPTNAFQQLGTPTNHITYWLAAYAQLPAGTNDYGWKTTTNVLNDTSVHAIWPGAPPISNPGWTPTAERPVTGGPAVPLDLAFKITSCGPVMVSNLPPTNVVVTWQGGGHLQWASNVVGPYTDVPGSPTSPFTDYSPSPTYKFYRLRCYP